MNPRYEKLKSLLLELFQLDQPDLDFGLYRIMHARSAEVTQFLDQDLLPQVKAAFAGYSTADKGELEKDLAKVIAGIEAAGMDPGQSPRVQELRERMVSESVDITGLEAEVYDHLYRFFRRYYNEGDFLSKRVYKEGVYAIPYEGEEVKLHWANADQYYVKTSEYLRDYAFRLRPEDEARPMRVHFHLVDAAEGEHGNVKAAEGKDRVFILAGEDFIHEEEGPQGKELVLQFHYRPATMEDWPEGKAREAAKKPPTQKDLLAIAEERILKLAPVNPLASSSWIPALAAPHVKPNGESAGYSRLRAHLNRYAARNTFDYFIHKDLGTFLRRELDFYIKNEIMHLDDVENATAPRVEQYLSKIKVVRKIAKKIIDFLAQLEDFQKKLWLKKKFVVETSYCIRLGVIPEEFYPEIAANDAQREEWIALHGIDGIQGDLTAPGYSVPLTVEFLKSLQTLMVDTRSFDEDFAVRLLEAVGDLNEFSDGVLFHSENFQALSMMKQRYRERVKCVYIDPPYNTDASPIIYRNGYGHSSWASLIYDRLLLDCEIRRSNSIRCIAIDDFEYSNLQSILETLPVAEVHHATSVVRSKPQGRPTVSGFSTNHEYAVFWGARESRIGRLPRAGSKAERYPEVDDTGVYAWANFRKSGSDSDRKDRRKSFYPVYVGSSEGRVSKVQEQAFRIPEMTWDNTTESWVVLEKPMGDEVAVWPIDSTGSEKVWTCSPSRAQHDAVDIRVEHGNDGKFEIYKKYRPNQDGALPGTWWSDSKYSASESGTKVLKDLFGMKEFDFPKSVYLVTDCLRVADLRGGEIVLDYFAGSGTTAHSVIDMNREDGGMRKWVLVEMGQYFDTVLLPRVKKVTFSPEWKDGRAIRFATPEEVARSPRILKIIRLESYEDTLNNLDLRRATGQQELLDHPTSQGADGLKEDYLLRYMLDVESAGSASILNVATFADPTAYTLKVKRPGTDESREVTVDLVETFNWLIGLTVQHLAAPQTFSAAFEWDSEGRCRLKKNGIKPDAQGPFWFRTVTGTTPDGRKTLVIWRKLTGNLEEDNLMLDTWFTKQGYSTKDFEFQLIYVNGDNNLENLKTAEDLWKVRMIEEDFHRLMFENGETI